MSVIWSSEFSEQFPALRRIATFSASVRGHELANWRTSGGSASASCTRCGAEVRVSYSAIQPDIDGPAIKQSCRSKIATQHAA